MLQKLLYLDKLNKFVFVFLFFLKYITYIYNYIFIYVANINPEEFQSNGLLTCVKIKCHDLSCTI